MELAENLEARIASHLPLREGSPSPTADLEKIQLYDGSAKALEAHASDHYKHN